ncbi:hypothetical protein MASR2M29_14730 [Spirochaetota bacterium]
MTLGVFKFKKTLLSLIACFLFAVMNVYSQPANTWYRSDAAGFLYEKQASMTGIGYEASVSKYKTGVDNETVVELYKDGIKIEKTISIYGPNARLKQETKEKNGIINEEKQFDEKGYLNKERLFLDDGSIEETRYIYEGFSLLQKVKLKDGKTYITQYRYSADGKLVSIDDNNSVSYGQSKAGPALSLQWNMTDDGVVVYAYDKNGHLAEKSVYKASRLLSLEKNEWLDGALAESILEENSKRIITKYTGTLGSASLPALQQTIVNGKLEETSEYQYDSNRRLVCKLVTKGANTIRTEHAYLLDDNHNEDKEKTRIFVNGKLQKISFYESNEVAYEEIYENEKLAARLYYSDGKKTKEEIIRDGKIIRTGNY